MGDDWEGERVKSSSPASYTWYQDVSPWWCAWWLCRWQSSLCVQPPGYWAQHFLLCGQQHSVVAVIGWSLCLCWGLSLWLHDGYEKSPPILTESAHVLQRLTESSDRVCLQHKVVSLIFYSLWWRTTRKIKLNWAWWHKPVTPAT